ncbi:aromatic ring-hydroxylating dioxygenase subunit alpha [Reyranella soli]|uniref:Ring hydroxylating subunit alpha n=1 Tax=Reyranella soli TaxID=1230389 RepID=A0A512N7Q9_9HYPH|nr:aromatic ring-hydroxylating dioxygenase subunit alpha [Reyranella soli]GEP55019.1 ring hydroxylating subunit alpha [Reyranella soli]
MDVRHDEGLKEPVSSGIWPEESLARVPYWVYQDEANYKREMERLFKAATWNFVCLEADIPDKGDYRTNHVGIMPVIAVRAADGSINCFENRCSHRGALIAFDDGGNVGNQFRCVYHSWSYDLSGNLRGIAFERGINGVGGMPKDFCRDDFSPRKLRTTTLAGLVFATLSPDTPPIEEYIGSEVVGRLKRVLNRPIRVMGRFVQPLPNNWKLYVENVKDTYHASILHTFLTTFRISRLTQGGGVLVSPDGGNHASYTIAMPEGANANAYKEQQIRSDQDGKFALADPSVLDSVEEFGDHIQLQILSVFPGFILQQIHNCLAVRHVVPRGVGKMDLVWTYFGFADDTPEMNRRRLRQQNLVGPAGFISMEDGCIGGFVQRGTAAAADEVSVIEMGGSTTESQATRATEASVRGFWKAYRRYMGY